MTSPETLPRDKVSEIYHDIYDFSVLAVSLGDILMWILKSALRADAAGRSKVHVHVICDPKESGFCPLQSTNYLADLLIAEALPAFYSHPFFSGLSIHRSRKAFETAFRRLAKNDPLLQPVYHEYETAFKNRTDFAQTVKYFKRVCTRHDTINDYFRQKGSLPKLGCLEDCLTDWRAFQSGFPPETFWVTLQFRQRQIDGGMPLSAEGLLRDAPFLTWYNFIRQAQQQYPQVRFVLLGRVQEKALELLRQPNVITLRALGMNLGHEITALIHSALYMGSLSGFAPAAHFSDVPYDVFNCLPEACENFGIAYGTDRIPNATSRQKLHYGVETTSLLLEALQLALQHVPTIKAAIGSAPGSNRIFIPNQPEEFPAQTSTDCAPDRLVRRNGRFVHSLQGFEGLIPNGWCARKARFVFGPSKAGDFVVLQIAGLPSSDAARLVVTVNQQEPMPFVLLNEYAVLEIPINNTCTSTEITLDCDRAFKVRPGDKSEYSFKLEGAGLISKRSSTLPHYQADKRDSREKIMSGIYPNGAASNLARLRIDNRLPEGTEVMIRIIALLPEQVRRGQFFRIQINGDIAHESFVSGKHLLANIPCPGCPRHLSLLMRFWDDGEFTLEPKENRLIIKRIEILPAAVKKAEIKSGYRSAADHFFTKLKAKISSK